MCSHQIMTCNCKILNSPRKPFLKRTDEKEQKQRTWSAKWVQMDNQTMEDDVGQNHRGLNQVRFLETNILFSQLYK